MSKHTPREPIYQSETDTYLIPLTRGHYAIVDACDVDLADALWQAKFVGGVDTPYAYGDSYMANGKQKKKAMHREILARVIGRQPLRAELIDHVNRNTLDNRRSNLRLANPFENQINTRVSTRSSTGYRGVVVYRGRFMVKFRCQGKNYYGGIHDSVDEAVAVYEQMASALYGEFAPQSDALKQEAS